MKKVKIKIVGFWDNPVLDTNPLIQAIEKNYKIEFSDEPDYIICSMFGNPYEYCKYHQVRIMFSGENYIPDFNLVDYGISPYPLSFLDRHFYLPQCINDYNGHCVELLSAKRDYNKDFLKTKKYFANFIAGHESEYGFRGDFFKRLSEYKRVESPGKYLNNMSNNEQVDLLDGTKIAFQKQCKFTLCFESTYHEGFVTEKLADAFYSDTIPIYYGSSTVKEIFNSKAFINVVDYSSIDKAIDRIIELDQNDDEYISMLREPIFTDADYVNDKLNGLELFVKNIFDQPLEKAYRRSRVYWPKLHENHIIKASDALRRIQAGSLVDSLSTNELVSIIKNRAWKRIHKK